MAWQAYLANGRPNTPTSNPRDVEALRGNTKPRVKAMLHDCPYKGELTLVSGLRDPGRQWDLRRARVGTANIWKFPPRGNPVTAVPARWNATLKRWLGGSKHQEGTAADMGGTARAMKWMRDNREAYGLALTVSSENWHLEADKYDTRTKRYHNKPTVRIEDTPAVLTIGSTGPAVLFAQQSLNATKVLTKLPYTPANGLYTTRTRLAVVRFQTWSNQFLDFIGDKTTKRLVVDGKIGPATSEVLLDWAIAARKHKG